MFEPMKTRSSCSFFFSLTSQVVYTCACIYISTTQSFYAQPYRVEWGAYQKMTTRDFYDGMLTYDSAGFFTLRSRYNALGDRTTFMDYYLFETLERTTATSLVHPESHKDAAIPYKLIFEDILRIGSRTTMLMTSYNQDKAQNMAFAQFINSDGRPDGHILELAKMKVERKSNRGKFQFASSPDKSLLLIYNQEPADPFTDEKFGLTVVDTNLQTVWTNEYTLPYKSKNFISVDFRIDNNGNVYMLSKIYLSKEQEKQKKVRGSNFYFILMRFLPEDEKNRFQEYIIQLEDKHPANCALRFDKRNNLHVAGYYAADKDLRKIEGLFFYTQHADSLSPEKINLHTLPDGFVGDFMTDAPIQFGEEGEPSIEITHLIRLEDGTRIIIAEHRLITETCFTDFRTALTTCNYNYFFNDLFVVKISPDDQVQWKIKINKRQVTRNDGGMYSSFTFATLNDKIVLLYNEHPKNFSLKGDRGLFFMNDPQRSSVALVEISLQGNVAKYELFSNERRKTWFRPRFALQINDQSLLFFTSRLRNHAIGRLIATKP